MKQLFAADSTRAVLVDWVEFELVMTGRPFYTDAMLNRADQVEKEPDQYGSDKDAEAGERGEDVDPEILEQEGDERSQAVWEELQLRVTTLGELYPFEVTGRISGGWRVAPRAASSKPDVETARSVYRSALVMSCFRNHHIKKQKKKKDREYSKLQTTMERQFQYLSALAAPNLHGPAGVVYSFGWPRRDGSDFQVALVDLVEQMGKGKVKDKPPANASGAEKDGTVDIVTWIPFGIPSVGDHVYFGQVASGSNWTDKPVQTYLKAKFFKWFEHRPAHVYSGATFMPFVRHTRVVPHEDATMDEAMAQEDRDQAVTYGTMVDRFKLTELYAQGLGPEDRRHQCEQPSQVLKQTVDWVQACRDYCAKAA